MTKQVLFVQGGGADAHDRWDNRLVESLERELGQSYDVRYPRMPNEADPRYADWKAALVVEFGTLDDGAMLVGHSIGGAILVHTLAEQPPMSRLGGIFLIAAPFIGKDGWRSDEIEPRTDFSERLPRGVPIFLYHGAEDDIVPFAHVHLYAKAIPQALVRPIAHGNHQLNNDLSEVARDIRAIG